MRKIQISSLLVLSLFATQSFALDMGSMLKSVAPIAVDSVAQTQSVKDSALLNSLSSLGVTPAQAAGGTAVLLNSAKTKMEPSQFSTLTKQTPDLNDILSSGTAASSLLGGASVGDQFKGLGMNSSMIGQFTPIILNYAKGYVSPEIAAALSAALSF
ncbi:MAG: DUF2780 domain-containing protein [Sulfurimonas sp.]|uniref:DUF2780 domain-containing protein n=1 Tax=Sulfurimonas sp. TaxID=2022749 RepID=UPI00262A475E|nr:DUF2780 domain-containing protein [Sulfurimonas sp.]MDD5399710.1 DUF2780 domain-containing protein [Sulfurimonas sp.]